MGRLLRGILRWLFGCCHPNASRIFGNERDGFYRICLPSDTGPVCGKRLKVPKDLEFPDAAVRRRMIPSPLDQRHEITGIERWAQTP